MIDEEKKVYEFYVAGVQHHDLKKVIDQLEVGYELAIEKEPTNQYDATAIKILFDGEGSDKSVMLGYVPGRISAEVTSFIDKAIFPVCEITKLSPGDKPWQQLKVIIKDDGEL